MTETRQYTTDEIIKALRETNGLVSLAARKLGCSSNTIYSRAKKVQSVQQAILDAREGLIDIAELKLREAVLGGEPYAVSLVLKTIGKNRGYVERQEHTGADGQAIQFVNLGEDVTKL
jgi:transposase-like protein